MNNDWESVDQEDADDETSRPDVRSKFPPRYKRRHIGHKCYAFKGFKGVCKQHVCKGRCLQPKPKRSHYEVQRPTNGLQEYPDGPEVITRLKHSGYPENTERRFRSWTRRKLGDKLEKPILGMPTSSIVSDSDSEGGNVGGTKTTTNSTEEFLLSLQQNSGDGSRKEDGMKQSDGDVDKEPSDTETVRAEDDDDFEIVLDGDMDVSYYVKPSLIAQMERLAKASQQQQREDLIQDLGPETMSSLSSLHTSDLCCSAECLSEETPEGAEEEPQNTTNPTNTWVEDVLILPGDPAAEADDDRLTEDVHSPTAHFDAMRHFLWREDQDSPLIDLRVRVEGRDFQTHRVLMVTFSTYFQALSDAGRLLPGCVVVLDSLPADGFARVLEWIYTSRLYLDFVSAVDVLRVAKALGVRPLVLKCERFMALMESHDDAMSLCERTLRNGLLHGAAPAPHQHLNGGGFPELRRSRGYLSYTASQLCQVLRRDDLRVSAETEVYDVACDWLLHAWDSRQEHVCKVMQCVRFKRMSPQELRDIVLQSTIAFNCHVVSMLLQALLHLALKAVNCNEPRLEPVPARRTCLEKAGDEALSSESTGEDSDLQRESSLATDQKELMTSVTTTAAATLAFADDIAAKGVRSVMSKKKYVRPSRKKKLGRNAAAARIQAIYRGRLVRRRFVALENAATNIQKTFRGHLIRQELREREKAAVAIQRGFRRYTDHKKYDFLTALASYSPAWRSIRLERSEDPAEISARPYFHMPPDPAFICFGGISSKPGVDLEQVASCIYAFDIQSEEWQLCGMMPKPRADAAACLLGNTLVLTGGYDPTAPAVTSTATVWRLDIFSGEWEAMPSLLTARRLHGQVVAGGKVYVVGGCGMDQRPLRSTEVYEPQLGQWTRVGSLAVPRFAAAVAGHCGRIWACGGVVNEDDGRTRKITPLVEVYDPEEDKWTKGMPLPKPRAFCDLASVNDSMLLIVGGVEGNIKDQEEVHVTAAIWKFDGEQRKWRYLMNMPGNRYKAKVVSRDPYWFVVGGESSISGPSLSTVECFDTHDQRWVVIPHLPVPLQGTCCVSVP